MQKNLFGYGTNSDKGGSDMGGSTVDVINIVEKTVNVEYFCM